LQIQTSILSVFRLSPMCIHLFFFQAEDGIRDGHVTGVQTCALPILALILETQKSMAGSSAGPGFNLIQYQFANMAAGAVNFVARSEERRVGKECRSLWGRLS